MSIPSRSLPAARDERWLALAVLCAGILMIVLDATIVNVALPAIQRDFGFSQSSLAWVVNAYLIAFGGVLLLAGRLGDLLGRRRIFLAGLARLHARLARLRAQPQRTRLIAARFVQGLGGAMTSAVILGMIVTMFTEPRERTRAISLYSFVAAAGALDRPARRRRPDRGARLALDLLRQRPDRDRDRRPRRAADRGRRRASASARAPTSPARSLVTAALMLGV